MRENLKRCVVRIKCICYMGFYLKSGKYVKHGEEIEVDEERWEKLKKYDNFRRVKEDK